MKRLNPDVRSSVGTALIVAAVTAVYYVIPVPSDLGSFAWALLFFCGTAALGVLILLAVIRLLRAGEAGRARGLIVLLTITILFFSWADKAVATIPGQFDDLHTRTDALYFNVSTLSTVGFGDVHAVGQLARAAVSLQIVFNLVFLGVAATMITGYFRTRAQGRAHASHPPADGDASGAPKR